jgi:hypothetical protein
MPKTITLYVCDICEQEYQTEEDAKKCESRGRERELVAVGDIVRAKGGFGWFNGDRAWVMNYDALDGKSRSKPCPNRDTNCFGHCCTFTFYYVVTAIDRDEKDPHRNRYHLETKAMTGSEGYRAGYTYNEGHFIPIRIPRPPAAVESSAKALIGNKAKHLL